MRRLCFIFGSVLVAGGLNVALAQHGGGHSSGGHAGVHIGHAPSATSYSTLSNHYPSPGQVVYPTPIGLQHQYSGYTGINRGVLNNGRGGRGFRGYGAPYLYPYYLSTFDDSPDYYYDGRGYGQGQDESAQTAQVTANLLGEQISQLSAEVDALRNERQPVYEAPEERVPYKAPPAAMEDSQQAQPNPAIVLVLNDGKKVQMKNYAVMGQDIWDFSAQPVKRISVGDVNVAASKAATAANGAEFPSL